MRDLARKTHHDRETVKKVLMNRARGKEPLREEPDTLRDVARATLEHLVYPAPHKLIELFKLDPVEWGRRASEMLFPGLGGGPLYHQALRQHVPSANMVQTSLLRQLLSHKSSLETAGVWEAVTSWDEAYLQYWRCMLDWYAEVSLLVEEAFEVGIAGEIDAERQRSPSPPGRTFRLADPFAGIPVERRDAKIARQLAGFPEAFAVVLMCDLFMLAASEQPSSATWLGELAALRTVRDKAVLAGELLAPGSVQWQGVSQTAKNVWEEPGDPCQVRVKTEAVAKAFTALDDATGALRDRLRDLLLPLR